MNDEDVVRLCGQPRSIKMISSMAALDVYDAWNYGDITIIFDQTGCKYDNTLGLVIKGIRTDELNRYGIDRCQNILGTLYSE